MALNYNRKYFFNKKKKELLPIHKKVEMIDSKL